MMQDSFGGVDMTRQALLAVAIVLSLSPFTTKALGQGAAEYSIITSHAAGAAAKGGKALSKATQQLSGGLQQKLSKSTEESRQTHPHLSRPSGDHPGRATQSIESAKGLEIIYGPRNAKTTDTKQDGESQALPCASSPGKDAPKTKVTLPCKAATKEEYPSVVNLSFEK